MKHKFQGEISRVLRRRSVKAEAEEMIKDTQFQEDLKKLLAGLENIDDKTPVAPDEETKKKKKK